ncbi:MAG: DNA polymerase III subunit beta [Microgenomates group bacterium]
MKFTLLQTNLIGALTKATRVISSKAQLPILQTVLIETKEEFLYIIGTNTETTIVTKTNAKITKQGGVCVPAKLFLEFVSTLPDAPVTCEEKEGSLHIVCEGYEATIPGVPKNEFPETPAIKRGKETEIKKDKLLTAMEKVIFSAATDEGRPILTGVKVKKTESGVLLVTTDGYRLSLKREDVSFGEETDVIIPAKTLMEVVRIGSEEKDSEKILFKQIEGAQLVFFVGNTEIYTRVIDGEYPNFEKILPKNYTTRVIFEKESFLRAVKSAALFARDNANIIKMHIEEGKVSISANTPTVGQNNIEMFTEVEGESGEIAFNSRFLLEFLGHFEEDKIAFEMTGSLNPGVFKSVNNEDYLHIIMPVRTTS